LPSPKFSIIVPVHNVRAYLRECLDSILQQSFRDFELVAVDDCSPDGSGEILDQYAAADDRVHVLHLPENVGLGRARDAGIDVATGEYLLFVDSDDTLTPGALEAMAARIEETGELDVLIFDYARTYWTGRVERNQQAELIQRVLSDVFRIDERPEMLSLLMIVWNKAYRREWVAKQGFRFPTGYYEDLPWTYPTLLAAQRIAVLDRVCVHYRQRRHGNILRSRNRKHFDVFGQYDLVFEFLDRHPELASWRPFLFGRMMKHCLVILTKPDRVPASARHEFFDRTVEQYRRYRPEGWQLPGGAFGLQVRAVARGDYRVFLSLRTAARMKHKTRRSLYRGKRTTWRGLGLSKKALLRAYYRAALRTPVDENLAVYAAYWYRGYACNPAAIYEEAKRLVPQIRGVWVVRREAVEHMPPGVEYVVDNTPEYYRVMAKAKYLVNNVNFPDNIVKREGTVHLQTQHGTPLKKMGLDLQEFPVGAANLDFPSLLKRVDRWDYLVSSNRFSAEVWERAYPASYISLESGYPRNDRLVVGTPADVEKVRASLGIEPAKTAVLYAPTFRDWQRTGFEPELDLVDLVERLGDDHVLLVRAHYFYGPDSRMFELTETGAMIDVSDHPVVEDLMLAADVLLTDYSSLMFDYANLDRPIVVYANDWDTYVRTRGVNFDLMASPPGVVATTPDELVDAFRSGAISSDDAARLRQEFRKQFCEYDDGHAAERVVRRVFLEEPTVGQRTIRGTGTSQQHPHSNGDGDDHDADDDNGSAADEPVAVNDQPE
jgi:CDP-glycerol glycerophosphotransferase